MQKQLTGAVNRMTSQAPHVLRAQIGVSGSGLVSHSCGSSPTDTPRGIQVCDYDAGLSPTDRAPRVVGRAPPGATARTRRCQGEQSPLRDAAAAPETHCRALTPAGSRAPYLWAARLRTALGAEASVAGVRAPPARGLRVPLRPPSFASPRLA